MNKVNLENAGSPVDTIRLLSIQNLKAILPPQYALILMFLLLQLFLWSGDWIPTNDSALYLTAAKNISDGEVGVWGHENLIVAPLYPLFLAPWFWLSSLPFLPIFLSQVFLCVLLLVFTWKWYGLTEKSHDLRLACFAILVLHPSLWYYARTFLSEALFLTLMIYAAWRIEVLSRQSKTSLLTFLEVAAVLVLTCLTRHAGVALLAGMVVSFAVKAMKGQITFSRAGWISVALSAIVLFVIIVERRWDHSRAVQQVQNQTTYSDGLKIESPILNFGKGVALRISECSRLVIPGFVKTNSERTPGFIVLTIFYGSVFTIILTGWLHYLYYRADAWVCACPFYMGIYAIWPFDQGIRFMFPLLPLLLLCFGQGVKQIVIFTAVPVRLKSLAIAGLLVNCAVVVYDFSNLPTKDVLSQDWQLANEYCQSPEDCSDDIPLLDEERLKRIANYSSFSLDRNVTVEELISQAEFEKARTEKITAEIPTDVQIH